MICGVKAVPDAGLTSAEMGAGFRKKITLKFPGAAEEAVVGVTAGLEELGDAEDGEAVVVGGSSLSSQFSDSTKTSPVPLSYVKLMLA